MFTDFDRDAVARQLNDALLEPRAALLCKVKDLGFLFYDGESVRVALNERSRNQPTVSDDSAPPLLLKEFTQSIIPSSRLASPIHTVISNNSGAILLAFSLPGGTLLALVSRRQVMILELTRRSKIRLLQGEPRVTCRTFPVSLLTISEGIDRDLSIIQTLWHPLSSSHLLVLTSDSCLRMFNVVDAVVQPEQKFSTQVPSRASAVAFTCGRGDKVLCLNLLTIFILYETGEVYGLCPVLPFGINLPSAFFDSLRGGKHDRWIDEVTSALGHGDGVPLGLGRPSGGAARGTPNRKKSDDTKRHPKKKEYPTNRFSVPSWDSDSDSDTEETISFDSSANPVPTTVTTIKPATYSRRTVALQGPLCTPEASSIRACDIALLPTTPGVVLVSYEDGVVDCYILFEPLSMQWAAGSIAAPLRPSNSAEHLAFVHYESLSLFDDPIGLPIIPRIHPTPAHPNEIIVAHSMGVNLIRLRWLPQLAEMAQDDSSTVESIFPGEIDRLLTTVPLHSGGKANTITASQVAGQQPVGSLFHFDNRTGLVYSTLSANMTLTTIALSHFWAEFEPLSTHDPVNSPLSVSSTQVLPVLSTAPPLFQRVRGFPEEANILINPEALQEFTSLCRQFSATHIGYLNHSAAAIQDRRAEVERKFREQSHHDFPNLLKDIDELKSRQVSLQQRINIRRKLHGYLMILPNAYSLENLIDRVQTLLSFANTIPSRLSVAEKDWFEEIKDLASLIDSQYAPRLEQLQQSAISLPSRVNLGQYNLSEEQLRLLDPVLQDEQSLLQRTKRDIESLQAEIEKLGS